jgi:HAD superfamily hydrolase (TIGR01509 family)
MSRSSLPAGVGAFDLVIFDCDGVLVDSELLSCRAGVEALAAIGHAMALEAFAERFAGLSFKDVRAALEAELGRPLPARFTAEVARRSADLFARDLRAVAGVDGALARLALPKCVASSSVPEGLEAKLRQTGLLGWFAPALFSSAMVAHGKPAPDLFLYAARRMGAAPERCLVIEDSMPGIAAARAAGMTPFGFAGASHCRGGHGDRLAAAGAALVFDDMRELPGFVAAARRA